jgi:uncharacterized Ntn-hydrolase superfamily protein
MVRRAGAWLVVTLMSSLLPTTAGATWSIAAVDRKTREVGVAVASCVEAPYGTTILPYVAGLAPGHGALAAQARFSEPHRDEALALLLGGAAPQAVIDAVLAEDPQATERQYGVVALDLHVAAFTGSETMAWAGHLQGDGVSVQGNILRGPEVVADALAAFESEAPGCPWTLADRLMLALEAGAARGGDGRCSAEQAALAAALRVALPDDDPDAPTLDLRIPSQPLGGDAPVALLRVAYDEWRRAHPPEASGCMPEPTLPDVPHPTSVSVSAADDDELDDRDDPPPSSSACRCRSATDPSWLPLSLVLSIAVVPRRRVRTRRAVANTRCFPRNSAHSKHITSPVAGQGSPTGDPPALRRDPSSYGP